jgi:putative acetyltransferase
MSSTIVIRRETPADILAIATVTRDAFRHAAHSSQTEHKIVDALRAEGALALSLVAVAADEIVGHVAFSPVTIDGQQTRWLGLGPLSVAPPRQRQGIGSLLVRAGLAELRQQQSAGCVVLGDPAYYQRFGFRPAGDLKLLGLPEEYFLAIPLGASLAGPLASIPRGTVAYHQAFEVSLDSA